MQLPTDNFDRKTSPLRHDVFAVFGENDGEWIKSDTICEVRA